MLSGEFRPGTGLRRAAEEADLLFPAGSFPARETRGQGKPMREM
jgi:hypothetical protein